MFRLTTEWPLIYSSSDKARHATSCMRASNIYVELPRVVLYPHLHTNPLHMHSHCLIYMSLEISSSFCEMSFIQVSMTTDKLCP